ncbi:hypothetical protein AVEN_69006-1 [Araneus ventricosus]|uniref:Uncharacterized protein n=1 Tax=Araneus ventricosus TaxID=182803 RepID=A0A4Y2HZ39_ARAVE|nr:hypothetical protein AVEN_69006-1 [Araneus ventricosus]
MVRYEVVVKTSVDYLITKFARILRPSAILETIVMDDDAKKEQRQHSLVTIEDPLSEMYQYAIFSLIIQPYNNEWENEKKNNTDIWDISVKIIF